MEQNEPEICKTFPKKQTVIPKMNVDIRKIGTGQKWRPWECIY